MSRPPRCRRIAVNPPAGAFKPARLPGRARECVELGLDELEALRLADLEELYQADAARRMGISRPTFGRLVACARHKVACALLQSKMLVFRGGPVVMKPRRVFRCRQCAACFEQEGGKPPRRCPECRSVEIERLVEACARAMGGRCEACAGVKDGHCPPACPAAVRRNVSRKSGLSRVCEPGTGPAEKR